MDQWETPAGYGESGSQEVKGAAPAKRQVSRDSQDVHSSVRALAEKIEKMENDVAAQRRKMFELCSRRALDCKRLDDQCDAMSLHGECLTAAIQGILQWIEESESTGLSQVVERLSSVGDTLAATRESFHRDDSARSMSAAPSKMA